MIPKMDIPEVDDCVASSWEQCDICKYQLENETAQCRCCRRMHGREDTGRPDRPWYGLFEEEFEALPDDEQYIHLMLSAYRTDRGQIGRYTYFPSALRLIEILFARAEALTTSPLSRSIVYDGYTYNHSLYSSPSNGVNTRQSEEPRLRTANGQATTAGPSQSVYTSDTSAVSRQASTTTSRQPGLGSRASSQRDTAHSTQQQHHLRDRRRRSRYHQRAQNRRS